MVTRRRDLRIRRGSVRRGSHLGSYFPVSGGAQSGGFAQSDGSLEGLRLLARKFVAFHVLSNGP